MILLLALMTRQTAAQNDDQQRQSIIEQRIETIAGLLEEDAEIDYTNLLEDLTYYYEHPLNLNRASEEQLKELSLLTDVQVRNLQMHIARYGPLNNIHELQAIRGFDESTIRNVLPFVTVRPPGNLQGTTLKSIFSEGTHDMFLRYKRTIEQQNGFSADSPGEAAAFSGTPDYGYIRYRFQYRRNLIAGFTAENDAGEQFNGKPDFFSGHVFYSDQTFVRKFIVGDYQALFGQGLTFWNGLGFGKSPFVMNTRRNAIGLRPYTSADENLFLRGAATTLGWKGFELTLMFSDKKVDANLDAPVDSTEIFDEFQVTSLQSSGLHRTESELEGKDALGEQVFGGNVSWKKGTFKLGGTFVKTRYDGALVAPDDLYRQFRFSGSENTSMGLDYQFMIRNNSFFGEFTRSANGAVATIHGVTSAISNRLSTSVLYRMMQKDFQPTQVNVFSESSTVANESGLFFGLQAYFGKGWTLNAYTDYISYPWLRFRVDAPSNGADYLVQLNYKPDKKHEFYVRYRSRKDMLNTNSADGELTMDYPVPLDRDNWRVHAIYQVHPNVQMKSRLEWTHFDKTGSDRKSGYLLYQDIVWKKLGVPLNIGVRYAVFDAPTWDARIYAYESDVLYAFSIPAYYGRGTRYYAMLKWDATRRIDVWFRYGRWVYNDRQTISSGLNEITGNVRSDVHIQVRLRL